MEHELSSNWSQQMTTSHAFKQIPHIASDLHKCHLVWGEMIHFIYQLQYYILFEVRVANGMRVVFESEYHCLSPFFSFRVLMSFCLFIHHGIFLFLCFSFAGS